MSGNNHIKLDGNSYYNGDLLETTSERTFKIEYTYPETTIFSSEVVKTSSNDRIYLNYSSSDTYPNLTLEDYITYSAHKITFVKLFHNIFPGLTEKNNVDSINKDNFVGEMIIEHSPITNSSIPVYLCFLLKKNDSNIGENSIDKLIEMSVLSDTQEKIRIGDDIPKQINQPSTAVTYTSKNSKVIVFITPILINNSSAQIIESMENSYNFENEFLATFDNLGSDPSIAGVTKTYTLHEPKHVNKSSEENDIYIDCQPTGESAETIATYNVPINSAYTEGKSNEDIKSSATNLAIFIFFIGILYFFVPRLYFFVVYNLFVLKGMKFDTLDKKASFVRTFDIVTTLLITTAIILLVVNGGNLSVSYAIYAFFSLALSIFIIIDNKVKNPDFVKVINYDDQSIKAKFNGIAPTDIMGLIKFIFVVILYPVYNLNQERFQEFLIGFEIFAIAFFLIFLFLGDETTLEVPDAKDIPGIKEIPGVKKMSLPLKAIFGSILICYATSFLYFISGIDKALYKMPNP
jgi:hypothetical protein